MKMGPASSLLFVVPIFLCIVFGIALIQMGHIITWIGGLFFLVMGAVGIILMVIRLRTKKV